MKFNKIRLENETQDLLVSITKKCERLNKQTQTKPQKTLEFKMTKPRETFSFKPAILIEGSQKIGLIRFRGMKVNLEDIRRE